MPVAETKWISMIVLFSIHSNALEFVRNCNAPASQRTNARTHTKPLRHYVLLIQLSASSSGILVPRCNMTGHLLNMRQTFADTPECTTPSSRSHHGLQQRCSDGLDAHHDRHHLCLGSMAQPPKVATRSVLHILSQPWTCGGSCEMEELNKTNTRLDSIAKPSRSTPDLSSIFEVSLCAKWNERGTFWLVRGLAGSYHDLGGRRPRSKQRRQLHRGPTLEPIPSHYATPCW